MVASGVTVGTAGPRVSAAPLDREATSPLCGSALDWARGGTADREHRPRRPGRPQPLLDAAQLAVPDVRVRRPRRVHALRGLGRLPEHAGPLRALPEPDVLTGDPPGAHPAGDPGGVGAVRAAVHLLLLPQGDLPQLPVAPALLRGAGAWPRRLPRRDGLLVVQQPAPVRVLRHRAAAGVPVV